MLSRMYNSTLFIGRLTCNCKIQKFECSFNSFNNYRQERALDLR